MTCPVIDHPVAGVLAFLCSWQEAKALLPQPILFGKDAIRIYVALGMFFGLSRLFPERLASLRALALLAMVGLASEGMDVAFLLHLSRASQGWWMWDSTFDLFNTLALPTALCLYARRMGRG